MAKLAFLGLGVMGYPMAGHLAAAGHYVTVYNRTATKAANWAAEHGASATEAKERGFQEMSERFRKGGSTLYRPEPD